MTETIKTQRCPICHKLCVANGEYAPFCSKRCADVDLGHWFNGRYAFAAEDLDELEVEELGEALENAKE